jgi:7-keto-8-aminopelargonate synthetase-like enzyme
MDRLNHASLYDAVAQSRAGFRRYGHANSAALEHLLRASQQTGRATKADGSRADRKLIVTDGVFSMDGDIAPLQELRRIADEHQAILVVDDAHGTGVLGPNGAGSCAAAGIQPDVEIGTLSKALGSLGGFVAGDRTLIEYLTNRARPLIFSTGLPPACVAAAHAALRVMADEPWRQTRLSDLSAWTRARLEEAGFEVLPGETPILPIMVGDERRATALAAGCLEGGVFIPAIRTPSVPRGQARLRMTLSAEHSAKQVTYAIEVLVEAKRKATSA